MFRQFHLYFGTTFIIPPASLLLKSKKKSYRYKWGDKVFVDFGCGNIQTELSFPHPSIVLYNFANTVIVAPTTSDDSPNSFSADIEEVIIKAKKRRHRISERHDHQSPSNQIRTQRPYHQQSALQCKELYRGQAGNCTANAIHGADTFTDGMDLLDCIRTKLAYILAAPQMQSKNTEILNGHQQISQLQTALEAAQQKIAELTAQLEKTSSEKQCQND